MLTTLFNRILDQNSPLLNREVRQFEIRSPDKLKYLRKITEQATHSKTLSDEVTELRRKN